MKKIKGEVVKKEKIIMVFFITGVIGVILGFAVIWKIFREVMKRDNQEKEKTISYYRILNQWLSLRQSKKTVVEFFEKNNYSTVAIYGMKEMGERLLEELEGTGIEVKCVIDQNPVDICKSITVIHPDNSIPHVDVVVVTASYYFSEIKNKLRGKVCGDIVSIDDVVYSKY